MEINKEIFIKISSQVIKLFNENETLKTMHNALFIGHYIYRKLGNEKALEFYVKYIDYFIKKGYSIYFKGHPRDNDVILPKLKEIYQNNNKFYVIENNLPIEIYNYNFDIAVGAYSGTLISLPYYRNIPSINLPLKELYQSSAGIGFKQFFALYDEFYPGFLEMEKVIGSSKNDINNLYLEIINKKTELANNLALQEVLIYKPNIIRDIFWSIIASFFPQKHKIKIKNFARKDFYNKIAKFSK